MARLRPKYRKDENGKRVLQVYLGEFYDSNRHPKLKRVSLGTRDYSAALLTFAELERLRALKQYDPWTDPIKREGMLLSDAIKGFLRSREGRSEKTVANYDNILRIFRESLPPGMMVGTVEQRHVNQFLSGKKLNAVSRRTYVRHLRAFFRWCLAEGFMRDDPTPTKDLNQRKERKTVPEFLTEEQFNHLLQKIESDGIEKGKVIPDDNRRLIKIIRFAVGTGLRRGEIVNLRWSAVDLNTRMLTVENTEYFRTKSGHDRSIPLEGDAQVVLAELQAERKSESDDYVFKGKRGGKLSERYLSRRFRSYREDAGLPEDISFHSLRHTFGSWWVMRGGDLYRLKEVLGHADIRTTTMYAHLRPDALREEMRKCFGFDRKENDPSEVEKLRAELARLKARKLKGRKHASAGKIRGKMALKSAKKCMNVDGARNGKPLRKPEMSKSKGFLS